MCGTTMTRVDVRSIGDDGRSDGKLNDGVNARCRRYGRRQNVAVVSGVSGCVAVATESNPICHTTTNFSARFSTPR